MVFGLGKGNIEISLEKYNFSPQDTIKGKVSLKLKKPVNAKQLRLVFVGEKITSSRRSTGSGSQKSTRRDYIHRFEMPLDGEKEYSGGEYPFEIKIPGDVLQNGPEPEGALGEAVKVMKFLGGQSTRIDWYLKASLDVPMGLDVTEKIQINVG